MQRRSPLRRVLAALGATAAVGLAAISAPVSAATAPARVTTLPTLPASPARVVLVGDSVAASVADALVAEAARRGIRLRSSTRIGCGVTGGIPAATGNAGISAQCVRDNDAFLASAAAEPVDAVIVMSSWEINDHTVDGQRLDFRTPAWDAWMTGQLDALHDRFGGAPLFLATVAPRAPLGPVATITPAETDQVLRYDQFLRDYAAWRAGETGIIEVDRILCPTDPTSCPEYFGAIRPRPGLGAHFDAAGAEWVAPLVLDSLQQAWEQVGAVATAPPGF